MPALALVRPSLLTSLYRAALFAVVVLLCLWALADPGVRRVASVAVGISMISFIVLWLANGSPAALKSIAIADLVGWCRLYGLVGPHFGRADRGARQGLYQQ